MTNRGAGRVWFAVVLALIPFVAPLALGAGESEPDMADVEKGLSAALKQWDAAKDEERTGMADGIVSGFRRLSTEFGTDGLRRITRYLGHRDERIALVAVRTLAAVKDEARLLAGKLLAGAIDAEVPRGRDVVLCELMTAAGRSRYRGALKPLVKVLRRGGSPEVAFAAVDAIGELRDPRAIADLVDRLQSTTSANLRGREAGGRTASQNPRNQQGLNGGKNNSSVTADGVAMTVATRNLDPVDPKDVIDRVYEVLSEILGGSILSFGGLQTHLREHDAELKKQNAEADAEAARQEKEISRIGKR